MVASSSAMSQSIVSSIIVRPRRTTGIACCRATSSDEDAAGAQAAAPQASSNNGARSPSGPRKSKAARCRATGKPTSCCSPDMAKGLLVLHERQTRFSIVQRPVDRKAVLTARTIARQLGKNFPQAMLKTISFDNGTGVRGASQASQNPRRPNLLLDPYSPWQRRGGKTPSAAYDALHNDLKFITAAAIKRYVQRLNNTPTQMPDFKTPAEAFCSLHVTKRDPSRPSPGRRCCNDRELKSPYHLSSVS